MRPYDGKQRKDVPLTDFVGELVSEVADQRSAGQQG